MLDYSGRAVLHTKKKNETSETLFGKKEIDRENVNSNYTRGFLVSRGGEK